MLYNIKSKVNEGAGNLDSSRNSGKKNIFLSSAIVGVLVVAVLGVLSMNSKNTTGNSAASKAQITTAVASTAAAAANSATTTNAPSRSTSASATPTASIAPTPTSKYKDGSYSAKASYSFPRGSEVLSLSVTLKNDIITAASTSVAITVPASEEYVNSFLGSYKPLVIGKNVSGLNLSRVAGASLTPNGFNDALSKIRQQAG